MKFKEFEKEIEALEKAGEVNPDKRMELMDAALVFQDAIQDLVERMNELPDAEINEGGE
jgi:cell division protein ZapA (FtsZ GTPase activity inhibitor)